MQLVRVNLLDVSALCLLTYYVESVLEDVRLPREHALGFPISATDLGLVHLFVEEMLLNPPLILIPQLQVLLVIDQSTFLLRHVDRINCLVELILFTFGRRFSRSL